MSIQQHNSTAAGASPRRSFLKQASFLMAGTQAAAILPLASQTTSAATQSGDRNYVTAETRNGKIRGVTVDGIRIFKGIPYGGTTAGKNRFMPPVKPAPWTGVRDALEWGHIAPQPWPADRIDYVRLIGWANQPGGQSEDCLVLNVWTPAIKDGGRRPVMVSFHGGGFATGSGNAAGYNGDPLARFGNVVAVTVNHRLGCLGYLHLADLDLPPKYAMSGTAGMLDCVAALEWIRDNIENFGGDPGNVMIFGQSGGGAKVSTLLSMPAAKGLFHRAAIQSGSALRLTPRETAAKSALRMLAQMGLEKSRAAELQDVPFEMMMAAQTVLGAQRPPVGFAPVVDGAAIPHHPFDPVAPEVSADVPIIVSTTLDDAALGRTDFSLDEQGLKAEVETLAGKDAGRVLSAYRRADPQVSPFLLLARMLTDRGQRKNAVALAERKAAQHRAPAYMYLWEWPSPGYGGKFGAVHGTDVGLAFHNSSGPITGGGPEGRAMADKLGGAWVAFARTGNPNHPGLPEWPAYTADRRATMIFDTVCRVENDPRRDLISLWEKPSA